MSNVFESINEDAEKIANKYSHFQLWKAYHFMMVIDDQSEYDKQVLSVALDIHRKRLREKLNTAP